MAAMITPMAVSREEQQLEMEMGRQVQDARKFLLSFLTPEETKTQQDVRGTGQPVKTFEDHAREKVTRLVENGQDSGASAVQNALNSLQAAVNDLWTLSITSGVVDRILASWTVTRKKQHRGEVPREELFSEAVMAMRSCIMRFDPDKGEIGPNSPLGVYAQLPIHRALDEYLTRRRAPVRLPRAVVREGGVGTRRTEPMSILEAPDSDDIDDNSSDD